MPLSALIFMGVVTALVGVPFILVGLGLDKKGQAAKAWPRVLGTVVDEGLIIARPTREFGEVRAGGRSYQPVVSFRTLRGETITWKSPLESSKCYPLGSSVTMAYDPGTPQDAEIAGTSMKASGLFMVLGALITCVSVGVWILVVLRLTQSPARDPWFDRDPSLDAETAAQPQPSAPQSAATAPMPAATPAPTAAKPPIDPGDPGGGAWVVGDGGTLLRCEKSSCRAVDSGVTSPLLDVDAAAARDVWAVGDGGALHYDGRAWSKVDIGTKNRVLSLWVSSQGTVWAGDDDGAIHRFEDGRWKRHFHVEGRGTVERIDGSGPNDIWALIGPGARPFHWDGSKWTETQVLVGAPGRALAAVARGEAWFAQGPRVWRWEGAAWAQDTRDDVKDPGVSEVSALMAYTPDQIWACDGKVIRRRIGNAWLPMPMPEIARGDFSLASLARGTEGEVWIVGSKGIVLRHWRDTWKVIPTGTEVDLKDVWVE